MADGVDESGMYGSLLARFESLEASHNKLKEQLSVVIREKEVAAPGSFTGGCFAGSPYARVLDCMGHAVYVTTPASRQIIFWNSAAEKLFGYKDYEVFGKRVINLLFDEEHHPSAVAIMKRLSSGATWSGQLPLKRRSGQMFMAMVTKSPMYEDNELVGIVTVSSDAAVFNSSSSGSTRAHQIPTDERSRGGGINLKKIPWHSQSQNSAVPHIASSVSNLASKILLRKSSDVTHDTYRTMKETVEAELENEDGKADKPPRVPTAKTGSSFFPGKSRVKSSDKEESSFKVGFFSKLQMAATNILDKVVDDNTQENAFRDLSVRREAAYEDQRVSVRRDSHIMSLDVGNRSDDDPLGILYVEGRNGTVPLISSSNVRESSPYRNSDVPKMKSLDAEDPAHEISESQKVLSSGESHGSGHGSLSSKDEIEPHILVDSDIRWEDLQLKEEIGQEGSYAVVYHGIWNCSDVAVKLYTGNQYSEGTLIDYQKEINIMRRLRHPNVLLFMGAVCSEEKLAIVTEFMTRGSLFKTLHRSKQSLDSLDIKRRLKMAIDVASGMNYLHHRNPPIVHRDLKSSNLLVDKNWTVKVGDFGLSKLKDATFLTTKSGRGTPQWMAPEILRNEPTTEKSDVFSFGVILWELITESIPWNNLNSLQVVGVVGFMDRRLDIPENIDPQISSIISDCWRSDPEKRPSFEDIIHRMTNLIPSGAGTTGRTTPSTTSIFFS